MFDAGRLAPVVSSFGPVQDGGERPAKRKRLTPSEKEEKARADAARKQEKEEQRAAREAEKARNDAEKKARAEERERKRREKEEEDRKIQADKEKKERSQLKLSSWFVGGQSSSPIKPSAGPVTEPVQGSSRVKAPTNAESEYQRLFKPFFVKEHVSLASNAFRLDQATQDAKSAHLDEALHREHSLSPAVPTNGISRVSKFFGSKSLAPPRGRRYPSVRKIMAMMLDLDGAEASQPTAGSRNAQMRMTHNMLKSVPMKFLCFREDVRPAYYGTVTSEPPSAKLSKLARNPVSKTVLPLHYEYDSEAEWFDDGDGEDVEGADDDDDDAEEDEEMGDFLDDSDDAGIARSAFQSALEPSSTGLCWENGRRLGPLAHMYKFRMEFMLGTSLFLLSTDNSWLNIRN